MSSAHAKEMQRYRTAIADGSLPIHAAPLESVGSLVSGRLPRKPPPYTCTLCGRSRLMDWSAAVQHVAARHTADFMHTVDDDDVGVAVSATATTTSTTMFTPLSVAADSMFENALVKIVNALTLDDAIQLATDALLGRTESDELVRT